MSSSMRHASDFLHTWDSMLQYLPLYITRNIIISEITRAIIEPVIIITSIIICKGKDGGVKILFTPPLFLNILLKGIYHVESFPREVKLVSAEVSVCGSL